MTKIIVLNPLTLDPDSHSRQHGLECTEESLTVQSDAQQADINFIVNQFLNTQMLPYGASIPTLNDDYSDAPTDFHAAMNYIKDAENLFMQYPAQIRSKFNNDAGYFLDFLKDPKNRDEAIKLGFIETPIGVGSADPLPDGGLPSAKDTPKADAQ